MKNTNHFSRFNTLVVAFALCCVPVMAMAQQKFVRAQATDSNKATAMKKAQEAAWKNYLGTLQGAKLDNILANEKSFLADLSSIVVDVSVVDETCTSGAAATCTVSIKAAINETMVDSRLRQAAQAKI